MLTLKIFVGRLYVRIHLIIYMDESFEAINLRKHSYLAQAILYYDLIATNPTPQCVSRLVFGKRHAFRMRRIYIYTLIVGLDWRFGNGTLRLCYHISKTNPKLIQTINWAIVPRICR